MIGNVLERKARISMEMCQITDDERKYFT